MILGGVTVRFLINLTIECLFFLFYAAHMIRIINTCINGPRAAGLLESFVFTRLCLNQHKIANYNIRAYMYCHSTSVNDEL